jgi:VIT1/CCC1 family predicted Fe2+/Mn2+ transporter
MWRDRYAHSLEVGLSFGLVSGSITSLGLIVGLAFGTDSRLAVIGGIVTIAIADALSDALGIHVAEESEGVHSSAEVWASTVATFLAKFVVSISFLGPVLLLDLRPAVAASVGWGLLLVAVLSWRLAKRQGESVPSIVSEHVGVAITVVAASALVGHWVSRVFV